MLSATLPSPLYPVYQQRFGFSQLAITVIFAAYSVSVIASLMLFGRLSDDIGRRLVLLLGIAFCTLSAVAFLLANGIGPILVGRAFSGLSTGIFTGTATAALVDLAPGGDRGRATAIAVAVNLGGLGTGQLLAGLLAQAAPNPLQLPFIASLLLAVPAAIAIWLIPETVTTRSRRWRLQRLTLPPEMRPTFIPAAIAGFVAFAIAGVFGSLVPGFLAHGLRLPNHAVAGVVLFTLLGFSVLGQMAVSRLSGRAAFTLGSTGLMLAAALFGLAVVNDTVWALLAATVCFGLSQGLLVGSGLGAINERTPPARRSEVASTYFVVLYVGLSVPVVGVGFLADSAGLRTAGIVLALGAIVVVGTVLAWLIRRPLAAA